MKIFQASYSSAEQVAVDRARLGLWMLLVAELMFFAGLVTAWIVLQHGANAWPSLYKLRTVLLLNPYVGLLGLALLLLSSSLLQLGLNKIRQRVPRAGGGFLCLGLICGAGFLFSQIYLEHWPKFELFEAYKQSRNLPFLPLFPEIIPGTRVWASCFFSITLFHALHAAVGLLLLGGFCLQALRGNVMKINPEHFQLVCTFWHFATCSWLLFYPLLYWI